MTNEITYDQIQIQLQENLVKNLLKICSKNHLLYVVDKLPKDAGTIILLCFRFNDDKNNYCFIKNTNNKWFISSFMSFNVDEHDYGEIKWSNKNVDSHTVAKILEKYKYQIYDIKFFELNDFLNTKELKFATKLFSKIIKLSENHQYQSLSNNEFNNFNNEVFKILDKEIYKYIKNNVSKFIKQPSNNWIGYIDQIKNKNDFKFDLKIGKIEFINEMKQFHLQLEFQNIFIKFKSCFLRKIWIKKIIKYFKMFKKNQ